MKKFYQKYKDYVVIGLFVLLGFKSCQSCSRDRTIKFNERNHTILVDSLENKITNINKHMEGLSDSIILYQKEIYALQNTLDIYEKEIEDLKDDNKYYKNTNKILVNTNKQIINKSN